MNVSEMMTAKPVVIGQNQTLLDAMEAMNRIGCHHLPVTGVDGHIVGIITESDCRRALNAPELPSDPASVAGRSRSLVVRSLMSPAPIIAEPDMPAEEAARLMLAHHVSCLPVMRGETLVGIITTSDVLIAFIRLQSHPHADADPLTAPHLNGA